MPVSRHLLAVPFLFSCILPDRILTATCFDTEALILRPHGWTRAMAT